MDATELCFYPHPPNALRGVRWRKNWYHLAIYRTIFYGKYSIDFEDLPINNAYFPVRKLFFITRGYISNSMCWWVFIIWWLFDGSWLAGPCLIPKTWRVIWRQDAEARLFDAGIPNLGSPAVSYLFFWGKQLNHVESPQNHIQSYLYLLILNHIIFILYSSYIHIVFILYSYNIQIIFILYSYYIHIIFILYSYYIHIIFILYSYYIHIIIILYSYYIHSIFIVYSYYIHITFILYAN